MKWVSRTHIGNVRSSNQDTLIIGSSVYGVADGMGGHRGGDVASHMAATELLSLLGDKEPSEEGLREAVKLVNTAIYNRQLNEPELSGMGTTLTVLWESENALLLAHVGDSRAYLLHEGALRQISEDHSLVGEMLRNGVLSKEAAAHHPYKNMITRAVGTDPLVEVDCLTLPKEQGDVWLLCSDGLSNYIPDSELQETLTLHTLEEAADLLLRAALDRGGQDNITLVIAEVAP
ncbi:MAG: Stp1/IreP family PP2C-type Ser/Thr phosphatase [Clostridia bacterium]|nr:Stp1/IreP family PP2C-type Ser/Thr phosphatase [Clostridia bacterium]